MMSRKARLMTMMMQGQGSQKCQTTQQTPCKWIQRLGVNPEESQKISDKQRR